ncbi:uncharacterized protein PODANS_5_12207 [Podospora anserina S mat+]|uniref:Podospora anserina S mat+ genomic DNA chromosome 5, supercontig 7 n=1 Tax=Podospora anserina (strain S / ATCC MYA-4624 / DSM 980 / FGSC 10383) TaxID=515849 RepID=B2AFP7_PODAN|nr:uncharacterized protein PODANS_5_12207 [Podospora anserina S mat+]CAP62268.1 unnamed protein product [Podospora anserina S mat+]CDP29679.1 Putative protein of unknown function [Podospora anserina S mat+]
MPQNTHQSISSLASLRPFDIANICNRIAFRHRYLPGEHIHVLVLPSSTISDNHGQSQDILSSLVISGRMGTNPQEQPESLDVSGLYGIASVVGFLLAGSLIFALARDGRRIMKHCLGHTSYEESGTDRQPVVSIASFYHTPQAPSLNKLYKQRHLCRQLQDVIVPIHVRDGRSVNITVPVQAHLPGKRGETVPGW